MRVPRGPARSNIRAGIAMKTIPADVTLIVVTYMSQDLLPDFFAALPAALEGIPNYEVIVVDNASTDDTVLVANSHWIVGDVVRLARNRGYAAGINAGIQARPKSRAYFVLNPDIRLWPKCVAPLLTPLTDSTIGITAPQLRDEHNELLCSLRREPTLLRALGEALLGGYRAGRWAAFGEIIVDKNSYDRSASADWATGGALVIADTCIAKVGRWDESFFLYEEEVEFALRARDHGFSLLYVPEAKATRIVGDSARKPHFRPLMRVNKLRLYMRRHGRLSTLLYHTVMIVGEFMRAGAGRSDSRQALRVLLSPSSLRRDPIHL
jgi:N-acetylglucosaminyl-diphospho-decaprenol L-rhamnosyltransferase